MKLSTKTDYAARAVLALARQYGAGVAVTAEELARETQAPSSYLVQIMTDLRAQNIVKSHRGKSGGYRLARPPAAISLADVVRGVRGSILDISALSGSKCPPELRAAWRILQKSIEQEATRITFQSLVDAQTEKDRMFYI
ncbi:MAG: Rrf2 family transcriptional regulator [Pedosphaera sp.]|nr:Rrf2 family transcriptional regulator [Pedosphaera sp.]